MLFKYLNGLFKSVVLNHTIPTILLGDCVPNGTKTIVLHAVAGILISATIIAGLLLSGVQLPSMISSVPQACAGTLIVLLTDAPVELEHLNVTIDSFSVLNESDRIDLPLRGGRNETSFDLLALQNITETISTAQIPDGNYTKMCMSMNDADATFLDGTWLSLRVPPEHVDIIGHFEMKSGSSTVLLIDMQADWVAISQSGNLRPVFRVKSVVSG